jgi:hypothetical protein
MFFLFAEKPEYPILAPTKVDNHHYKEQYTASEIHTNLEPIQMSLTRGRVTDATQDYSLLVVQGIRNIVVVFPLDGLLDDDLDAVVNHLQILFVSGRVEARGPVACKVVILAVVALPDDAQPDDTLIHLAKIINLFLYVGYFVHL